MSLTRWLWKAPFNWLPRFPCSTCGGKGNLVVLRDTLKQLETASSKEARSDEGWFPNWYDGRFSALMECESCRDVISVCGDTGIDESVSWDDEGEPQLDFSDVFFPRYFSKAPHIIDVAKECPNEVKDEIVRSFALYWCDEKACANVLRSAIDVLLTQKGIPAERRGKNERLFRISLHDRIEQFEKINAEAAKLLLSLKIFGNVGSHGDFSANITKSDLLDAYDIFDYLIELVYKRRAERIAELAAKLKQRMTATNQDT
jgi:hypothetical protein